MLENDVVRFMLENDFASHSIDLFRVIAVWLSRKVTFFFSEYYETVAKFCFWANICFFEMYVMYFSYLQELHCGNAEEKT